MCIHRGYVVVAAGGYWYPVGAIQLPLSGENADRGACPDRGLCAPADHGAWAEAAVIYVCEVVSESSAEEVRESSPNVFVETVGGSEKRTCFRREGEWGAPGGGHRLLDFAAESGGD